jgi:hypothetical protein
MKLVELAKALEAINNAQRTTVETFRAIAECTGSVMKTIIKLIKDAIYTIFYLIWFVGIYVLIVWGIVIPYSRPDGIFIIIWLALVLSWFIIGYSTGWIPDSSDDKTINKDKKKGNKL